MNGIGTTVEELRQAAKEIQSAFCTVSFNRKARRRLENLLADVLAEIALRSIYGTDTTDTTNAAERSQGGETR